MTPGVVIFDACDTLPSIFDGPYHIPAIVVIEIINSFRQHFLSLDSISFYIVENTSSTCALVVTTGSHKCNITVFGDSVRLFGNMIHFRNRSEYDLNSPGAIGAISDRLSVAIRETREAIKKKTGGNWSDAVWASSPGR